MLLERLAILRHNSTNGLSISDSLRESQGCEVLRELSISS
jgi:hypothetical protein